MYRNEEKVEAKKKKSKKERIFFLRVRVLNTPIKTTNQLYICCRRISFLLDFSTIQCFLFLFSIFYFVLLLYNSSIGNIIVPYITLCYWYMIIHNHCICLYCVECRLKPCVCVHFINVYFITLLLNAVARFVLMSHVSLLLLWDF